MKRLCVLMVAALFAAPALVQGADGYVGASGGAVSVKSFCDGTAALGIACDDSSSGFRAFAGVGDPRGAALELGYFDLGKVGGSFGPAVVSVSASGFDVSGVFGAPLGSAASIYSRIGMYRTSEKLSSNVGLSGSSSSTGLTFGFGVLVSPAERVGLRLEWQRYGSMGDDEIGKSDVDVVWAGALIRF